MLSDEVIEKVTERLVNRIEQGNTYVLEQIGKSIKKIGTLTPSKAHELEQMLKFGGDYDKIVRKLAEITKLNVKDIKKIFEEVAKSDYQFAKQFYDYRGKKFIPYEKNIALKRQVDALSNIMIDNYISKTKSIGFSLKDAKGNVIFQELGTTYQDTIDKAIVSISQGKTTFQQEMYNLMKELGSSGIKTIDYESGRSMRLDSYFRMLTKDSLRQLHNEEQQIFGEEFDSDGVEISVHSNPALDHASAQGRQFSISKYDKNGNEIEKGEWEKLQEDGVAKDYTGKEVDLHLELKNGESAEGFRPISTYNCYHYVFAIVLGVSEPEYSNKELQQIIDNNNKGFDFDGKHYSMYEGTQLQRKLETEIRKQKDIQIMAKAGDNKELISESQDKIRQLTQKYKELSDISGLPTKMQRMRVPNYKRVAIQ